MASLWLSFLVSTIIILHSPTGTSADKIDIGVVYERLGTDIPYPPDAISLYKKYSIGKIRILDPDSNVLEALRGSDIDVTLGVPNYDIQAIAFSIDEATAWFNQSILPYINDVTFAFIAVGNELIPGDWAQYVAPAMQNLQIVLRAHNLGGITVTTIVGAAVLETVYPPSAGLFTNQSLAPLQAVLKFLSERGSPILMINVYPYSEFVANDEINRLDFAQFTTDDSVIRDEYNLTYTNLFDVMVDSFYWAMERAGAADVGLAVSASGWPSAENGNLTTPELASTYNKNFVQHLLNKSGTPKRPGAYIEGFIYTLFDEVQLPPGIGQHFGLFHANMTPVYPVFTAT